MADIKIISPTERYKAIADAIREKSGTTELMQPADMPQMIMELSGGAEYTDITYNEDNTITLTDKNGTIHTMECEYSEDGKLMAVSYDGKPIELTYDGDLLVKVGKTAVDVTNAPATSGATLNIAYGETPPEDTSKLWIKANEPENISVGSGIEGVGSVEINSINLPTACFGVGCARVGQKIYLFGGNTGDNTFLNTINVFDPETSTITTLEAVLPNSCYGMGCVAVGTKIYLFGGAYSYKSYGAVIQNCYSTISVFDTETSTITTLETTLPNGLGKMGCVAVGTKIYLFGGEKPFDNISSDIYIFDIETETISKLSARYGLKSMGCTSVGTKIYLFGGYSSDATNVIYVFDTENEKIMSLATTLPTSLQYPCAVNIGNKIYLFSGYYRGFQNNIYEFDPETETIATLEAVLPFDSYYEGCCAYGNKAYLFGGCGSSNFSDRIICFTLTHELAKGDIEVQSGLLNNKFNLIDTDNARVEIGVENVYVGNENNEAERVDAYLHNGTDWEVLE